MPLTFEQVRSLFESSRAKDPSRFGNMSLNDFVDYGNRGTGSNMFEAGRQNMLEEFNAGLQHDIGAALNYLGLPQAGRDVGSSVGAFLDKLLPASTQPNFYREQLGSIGQEIPQGVLENIPLFRGAKGVQVFKNTLLSAGLGISNTYSKTQDLGDAAYTAGITALTPVLGALGRKAGLSFAEALSRRLGNEALADALKAGEGLTAKTAAKVGGITGIATGLTGIDVGKNYMTDNPAGLLGGLTPTQYGVTQLASLLPYELFGSLMEPKAGEEVRPSTMFEEVLARADEKKRVLASQAKLMEPMEGEFGSELITYEGPPTPDLPVTKAWAGKLDQFVGPQPFVQPYVAFESKAHTIWGVGGEEAVPEGRVEPTAPVVEAPLTHPVAQATARTSYDTAVSKGASIPKPWADQFGVPEGYEQKGLLFVKKETVPASTEPPVVVDKPAEVAKINTDIDALSSTPPPADPATLLQSVEGTVATAGKHGVPLPNDVQRGKTVENKTSKGDKLDEALPQQAQSDQNNVVLQLRIKRETLPDTVREETVNVVKAHADVMETEMAAVAADETLTPKAKADKMLALQREHDLYRAALMRHDGEFDKQIKVSEAYAKWKNDPNRDVGKLSKKMSDAVADVKRKEKNKEKTKTEGKKVVAKEQKSEAMADVYAEMVREAQTDKTTADIIKIFHHAATVIKPGDGAVSEVEMLAVGLTKWWKATEVEKRTVPEAKKVLARILKNAGQTRTEQGAEVFLRKDGTFGPATKENGHNLFPSYEDAMTFMQDLPSKEHLNHLYTVKRDPDGKGFRLSKRAKTKNESITPIDDEYEQSYVLDREQFTGDVTNGDLSDEFLDAHFMYVGSHGLERLREIMSPAEGQEFDRKILLAHEMSRNAGLSRKQLTPAQKAINNQIRIKTGFFRDPFTGQWMYEVSDRDFSVNGEFVFGPEVRTKGVKAGDLFRHNTLFEMYPEMKGITVVLKQPNPNERYRGMYDPATKTMTIVASDSDLVSKAFWKKSGLSIAIHEFQHAVQEKEGFAFGTNLDATEFSRTLSQQLLDAKDYVKYPQQAGAIPEHLRPLIEVLNKMSPDRQAAIWKEARNFLALTAHEIYYRSVGEIFARDAEMRRLLDDMGRKINEPLTFGGKGISTEQGIVFTGSVTDALYRLNEGDRNVGASLTRPEGTAKHPFVYKMHSLLGMSPAGRMLFGNVKVAEDGNVPRNLWESRTSIISQQEKEMYRLLVPEAFVGEKVNVKLLDEKLRDLPAVEVHTYGQSGQDTEAKRKYDQMTHEWYDTLDANSQVSVNHYLVTGNASDLPRDIDTKKVNEYRKLYNEIQSEPEYKSPRATTAYNQVSPLDTTKHPVKRIDVVLPTLKEGQEFRGQKLGKNEEGGVLWTADNLHENLPNTLGWAMVQEVEHNGEKKWVIGEMQSRWAQEQQKIKRQVDENEKKVAQEGLRGMTQEGLDRNYANARKRISEKDHPLLSSWESLVLKAVLDQARRAGVRKVVLSDGETAMMTEGHDKQGHVDASPGSWLVIENGRFNGSRVADNRSKEEWKNKLESERPGSTIEIVDSWDDISQEGGMRAQYDKRGPDILRKLTGKEGVPVDLGVHKNANDQGAPEIAPGMGGGRARATQLETVSTHPTSEEAIFRAADLNKGPEGSIYRVNQGPDGWLVQKIVPKLVGSPVFRTPEGKPKTNITGREYNVAPEARPLNYSVQDPTQTPFGRAVLFMTRFLTRDGRDERFAARTALDLGRVASILGDSLARWTELRGQRADDPRIGMEAKTAAGRIIALRALGSEYSDALASGVAFHELGEVFLREFEAGTLPQDLSAPMQKFMEDVVKASMAERRALLTMLHDEMLPKSLRGDDLKAALLHPRNLKRPNEVMANVVAMITHASAHESNTTMGEHLMNLPWNMMQGVRAVFRYIRDGFRTLKSAMGYETLGNKLGLRLNNDNLFSLTKQLNSLVQNVSRHDMVMEQVSRASGLYSGGLARLMDEALVNPVWIQNIDGATKPVANFMSLGSVEKAVHDKVRKALPPLHTLDERPELRPLFNVIQQESMTIHAHMRRANALMYAVDPNQPLGPHNMDIKNGPLPRVTKDSTASDVLHKVLREAQVKGDAVAKTGQQGPTVFDLVANNDPEVTGLLGRLNPAQRADVLEVIARSQEVNKLMAEDMYASNLRAGAKTMGVGLITKGLVPKDAAVAEDTASRIIEAAGDPNPLPLQQAVAALTPDPLLQQAVIDLALDRSQMAKKMYDQMLMRPYYITEQRLKQFHVTYKQNNGNKTGLADFNTEKEALDFIKDVRANPAYTLVDTAPRNSRKGFSKSQDIEPLLEQLANEQNKTKARLEQSLLTLGLTQDQVDNQLKMISFTTAVEEGHKLAVSGTMQLARKFAPGREFLDMIEQQSRMVNIYARKMATRDTDLSVALMKHDDKIYNDATKVSTDHAEQTIENGRIPDNQAQRIVNTMGYLWFVSSQISNTIMEQSSQLFQLAPKLVEEGAGISQSYKLVTQANGMLMQYGLNGTLPPEYQKLMNRLDLTGRGGQGSWAEADPVIQNESLAGNPRQAKGWMSVGTRLAQLSTKPYQMAVRYNEMVAAFASFKMLRERLYPNTTTLSPKEFDHLFAETVRISGLTQASFGKVNRPTMLFSTKDPLWRTSASMLYSLQGFAAGLYANVLRQARKGFGQELKSIVSPAERTDAKKAFTMTMATLVSAAGLAGIPMLMPLLKLIEPLTEKDFNSEITAFINRFMTEQFDAPTGDFVSQLSQHGLAHAMGMPVDISQRIAPGGLFGFNSYNGFDKERLVGGASLAIASNLFASVQAAEQGNWSQAFEKGLPPIIGHMASMAASGGNITASKGGVAIANPSSWQKIGYTLGLKPRELINYQDNSAAIKRADFIAKQQSERLVKKAADEVARGNPDGAIKLLGEEYQRSGTTFDPNAGFERVLKELEKRQFGTDVRDEVTLAGSNVWDRLAGRVVPEGKGSQMERLMFRDSIKQGVTGRGYAPRQYNSAMIEDLLRNNNPSMSSARAGAVSGWIQGQGQESEWAKSPFELLAGVR